MVFQFQFETVANRNGWEDEEKAFELILALKGFTAEILETIPASRRNNYNDLLWRYSVNLVTSTN